MWLNRVQLDAICEVEMSYGTNSQDKRRQTNIDKTNNVRLNCSLILFVFYLNYFLILFYCLLIF